MRKRRRPPPRQRSKPRRERRARSRSLSFYFLSAPLYLYCKLFPFEIKMFWSISDLDKMGDSSRVAINHEGKQLCSCVWYLERSAFFKLQLFQMFLVFTLKTWMKKRSLRHEFQLWLILRSSTTERRSSPFWGSSLEPGLKQPERSAPPTESVHRLTHSKVMW